MEALMIFRQGFFMEFFVVCALCENEFMKTLLLSLIFFASTTYAQNGGMRVLLQKQSDNCYWSNQLVYCHLLNPQTQKMQLVDSATTDGFGWVNFNRLKGGKYQLTILDDSLQWSVADIQVQDKQLFVTEVKLTSFQPAKVNLSTHQEYVEGNPSAKTNTTITREDIQRLPSRETTYIDGAPVLNEVVITAYRVPLYNVNGNGSTVLIQKQASSMGEFNALNSTPGVMASRMNSESINSISIRGARMDANAYYVDGVRVRGIDVPNSMIGSVQLISGGIPANYGDVTGGVVLVNTDIRGGSIGHSTGTAMWGRRATKKEEILDPVVSFDRFAPIYENQFLASRANRHSTFGMDVDRASWSYCKRILENGGAISRDAVKVEEFINSFPSTKIKVKKDEILHVEMERLNCPWNQDHELVAIHLKADDMKQEVNRMHHQFVFLLDVSGSMQGADRLDLIKEGMKKLVYTLDERDRVAIVTYAGYQSVALPMTTCDQKQLIINAIDALGASGSTNGMGGLQMAYDLALNNYDSQANNRVILATDGDFNVGISNPTELEEYISAQRGKGIYLTALGVGMGNYRNDILETLADRGDGNHFYIQNLEDAEKVLIKEIGTLITVARDTKMDVQFNPEKVKSYRLLGYENRLMPSEHFRDDTKDGGEIGVNHQVVALYEIELGQDPETLATDTVSDSLNVEIDDLVAVRLRFKPMKEEVSVERGIHLKENAPIEENPTLVLSAAFALEMRNSPFKGNLNAELLSKLRSVVKSDQVNPELVKTIDLYLKRK